MKYIINIKTVCPYHRVSVAHVDAHNGKYVRKHMHTHNQNMMMVMQLTHTYKCIHERQLRCQIFFLLFASEMFQITVKSQSHMMLCSHLDIDRTENDIFDRYGRQFD